MPRPTIPTTATRLAGLASILWSLSAVGPSTAQTVPTISLGPPQVGGSDIAPLQGSLSGLPVGSEDEYVAVVQGMAATMSPGSAGSRDFSLDLPIGPEPPVGGFESTFPYARFYTEFNRAALPLLGELVHEPTGEVLDRRKTFFYDLRQTQGVDTARDTGQTDKIGIQITDEGVDALERPHLTSLPRPDAATFDALLEASHPGKLQSFSPPTGYFAGDKTCTPMKNVSALFKNTPEFIALKVAAGVQYAAFQAAQTQALPTFPFCVQTPGFTKVNNYEVCVGRIDGSLTKASLTSVSKVNLEPAATGLESTVTLGRINQKIDVDLRDVSIRWKGNPTCLLRLAVTASVADATIENDPDRQAWARCTGLNAIAKKAKSALAIGLPFFASRDPADPETFDVHDGGSTPFSVPASARTPNSAVGTCAEGFVNWAVDSLLHQYYDPLEDALETAWFDGTPKGTYAKSADWLLTPAEHGGFDADLDHALVSELKAFGGLALANGTPVDGLYFRLETDALVKPEFEVSPAPETFVYAAPESIIWSEDGLATLDLFPVPFDVSLSTTTGALNQVLRELMATERVNFDLVPDPGQPTLGQVLSLANPLFAPLADPAVVWQVKPTVAPFTSMIADPQGGILPQRVPVAYHWNDLRLTAVIPGVGGAGDQTLLKVRFDFLDPDLQLRLAGDLGARFLDVSLGDPIFVATVVDSDLPGCPMQPHTKAGLASCDRLLELALTLLLQPATEAILVDLLSDLPAPQFWDAGGLAHSPIQVTHLARYSQGNRIILYGSLP